MRKFLIVIFCLVFVFPVFADETVVGIDPEGNNVQIGIEPTSPIINSNENNNKDDFIYYDCIPLPEELQHYIWNSCKTIGLDYCFALAIMEQESTFRQYAKHSNSNGTTDRGLWQINGCNIKELKKAGIITSTDDLFDPYKCTDAAMWELSPIIAKFGNAEKSYAVYNTGNEKINSNKNSRRVMQYWEQWKTKLYNN